MNRSTAIPDHPSRDPTAVDIQILEDIAAGTAGASGERFFQQLVTQLARALRVSSAFVTAFDADRARLRTLAVWADGALAENIDYDLSGSPCEQVSRLGSCFIPSGLRQRFPGNARLAALRGESYFGVPLIDPGGQQVGQLAVVDTRPMAQEPVASAVLRIFAGRAVAEIQAMRREAALRQSEETFRRILAGAMDAIVSVDAEDRIVLFNGAAERIFHCTAAAVLQQPIDRLLSDGLCDFLIDYRRRASSGKVEDTCVWAPGGLMARRFDGETFPIEATFSRIQLDAGTLDTIILRDVNDRAQAAGTILQLQSVTNYLREELESEQHYREIVGSSPALMEVLASVERVADTDAGVLVLGETGTGKELVARAIHQASRRRGKPLIKINCAAIPRTLVESELFGHEKGAFTGATRTKIGRFELADGGTIFLDEIGEIPNFVQVKLLRVLQERIVERVGGSEGKPIDVRVIAATNRNLEDEVRRGRFRADLYFRLNVFPLRVPSLRERPEDIPQLAQHFVDLYGRRFGRPVRAVSATSMERLLRYEWPGNIRELENLIERAVILARGEELEIPEQTLNLGLEAALSETPASRRAEVASPPPPPPPEPPPAPALPLSANATLEDVERRHILSVLDAAEWVIDGPRGAARVLDLHPNTLRSRMKRLGIVRKS